MTGVNGEWQAPPVPARRCLVTGAGRGIGAAVALRLSADGHSVALTARSGTELAALAERLPGRTLVVPADLTGPAAADTVVSRVEQEWGGPVEVLVLNAGAGTSAPLARTTDEDWARMLDLNLTAPFRLLRRALPGMVGQGWGRVVAVASIAAKRAIRTSARTPPASTGCWGWSGRRPPRSPGKGSRSTRSARATSTRP